MKLATYLTDNGQRLGVVDTGRSIIFDPYAASSAQAGGRDERLRTMEALITAGPDALADLRRLAAAGTSQGDFTTPLSEVRLLAPLPVPAQFRDCCVFERHIRDGAAGMARVSARLQGRSPPEPAGGDGIPAVYRQLPVYYISNRFNVVGPDAEIVWPGYSKIMDFELEIAAVIGRGGRNIDASQAAGHIFGYTIFNDFSARDRQSVEMTGWLGPAKGKSFDGGNAFGPWIVTPDELGDYRDLKVCVKVNGEEWIRTDMRGMLHGFEDMIAYISRDETVHPAEIIASGTVGGCCGLELDRFLADGDVIELDVDRIGILRNTVRMSRDDASRRET